MRVWQAHKNAIQGLAFSPDGTRIVTAGGADPAAIVWEAFGSGEPVRLSLFQETALSVAFTPDGRSVAVGRPWAVELWSLEDVERQVRLEGLSHFSKSLAFSPDVRSLLSAGIRRSASATEALQAMIWSLASGKATYGYSEPTSEIVGLSFAADATRMLWAHGQEDSDDDMPATLTDIPTGTHLAVLESPGRIHASAMAPDGLSIATATRMNVHFWPLAMVLGDEPPNAAWLSALELRRLSGRAKEAPRLLPAAGLAGPPERIDALAYTPDGQRLLTGSAVGPIRIWRVPQRLLPDLSGDGPAWDDRPVAEYDWGFGPVTHLAVAPDGLTAAAGSVDGRVVVWDLDS